MLTSNNQKVNLLKTLKLSLYILIYSAVLILLLKVIAESKIEQTKDTGQTKPSIEQPMKGFSP